MTANKGMHFKANHSLPNYWGPAFNKYLELIETLCVASSYEDAPWEHLEKSNSALLAAALISIGVPALPEAIVTRNNPIQKGYPRVDICIICKSHLEMVECKKAEYKVAQGSTIKAIDKSLKEAEYQLRGITAYYPNNLRLGGPASKIQRLALAFGLPLLDAGTSQGTIQSCTNDIIHELRSTSNIDAAAWIFPAHYSTNISKRYANRYYFGTFIAARATF